MSKRTIRHYLMIAITGMFCWLTTGVVSAHVGATKTGWNDLAPEVRAEMLAVRASLGKDGAEQPGLGLGASGRPEQREVRQLLAHNRLVSFV